MTLRGILQHAISVLTCALAFFLVNASQLSARIAVRSGEHANFSRLVFDISPPVAWGIVKDGSDYVLTIDSRDHPANLSRIYKFIPRSRLTSITVLSAPLGQYRLSVSDNFHAEAFEISPGRLVVDIKSGSKSPPDKPLPYQLLKKSVNETHLFPPDAPDPLKQSHILGLPVNVVGRPPRKRQIVHAQPAPPPQLIPKEMNTAVQIAHKEFTDIDVLKAQENLVHQLGRAMTQGVISPSFTARGLALHDLKKQARTQGFRKKSLRTPTPERIVKITGPMASDILPLTGQPDLSDHINFETQTVFDRGNKTRISHRQRSLDGSSCMSDTNLEVASWSPVGKIGSKISDMRSALIGEFDKVDPQILTSLVRLYVAEGFGVEALALMKSFPGEKIKDAAILAELARIIEIGAISENKLLANQASCSGAAAMWAILARPEIPLGEVPDINNLNEHFSQLPINLRRRIGPALGAKLLAAGFINSAESIEHLISRAPGEDGPNLGLFQAKIDIARGRMIQARSKLQKIIDGNHENAADAVFLLIETYLVGSEPIPETLITEISARAFESRWNKSGEHLLRAELMALSKENRQMTALEVLAHETDIQTISPETSKALIGEVFSTFDPPDLDAVQFTRAYFRFRKQLSQGPDHDVARRHISTAFLAVGLPGTALDVLDPLSGRLTDRDRELLGKIFLAKGMQNKALKILANVKSQTADKLRVQIFSALGKYDHAFAVANSKFPTDPEVPILAWRAGEWRVVATNDKSSRGNAAAYVLNDPKYDQIPGFGRHLQSPQKLSLASLNDILVQSRASHDVLNALLTENPRP